MKMSVSKPRASVSEMEHTNIRRKLIDPLDPNSPSYVTSIMRYPVGHPLRDYKDAKRAKKAARVAQGS